MLIRLIISLIKYKNILVKTYFIFPLCNQDKLRRNDRDSWRLRYLRFISILCFRKIEFLARMLADMKRPKGICAGHINFYTVFSFLDTVFQLCNWHTRKIKSLWINAIQKDTPVVCRVIYAMILFQRHCKRPGHVQHFIYLHMTSYKVIHIRYRIWLYVIFIELRKQQILNIQ
jgi:hypothetical protein